MTSGCPSASTIRSGVERWKIWSSQRLPHSIMASVLATSKRCWAILQRECSRDTAVHSPRRPVVVRPSLSRVVKHPMTGQGPVLSLERLQNAPLLQCFMRSLRFALLCISHHWSVNHLPRRCTTTGWITTFCKTCIHGVTWFFLNNVTCWNVSLLHNGAGHFSVNELKQDHHGSSLHLLDCLNSSMQDDNKSVYRLFREIIAPEASPRSSEFCGSSGPVTVSSLIRPQLCRCSSSGMDTTFSMY